MKAKIKAEHKPLFNPHFVTVIMGRVTKVTLSEAENQAEKWINSPIGSLYENHEQVRESIAKRTLKVGSEVLNMNHAKRGYLFDPEYKSNLRKAKDSFLDEQKKKRERLAKKLEKNLAKRKEQEEATKKAINSALRKERAKAKKEAKPKEKVADSEK